MINGLTQLNIELTSRCNKKCSFCGHQDKDVNKVLKHGDIDLQLLTSILEQVPRGTWIQFHRDGEPLLYPHLFEALLLSRAFGLHTNIVTNGKLLVFKAPLIIDILNSIVVSVFDGDEEREDQYRMLKKFLGMKKDTQPLTMIKIVGDITKEWEDRYMGLGIPILRRQAHIRGGSYDYQKNSPMIPEIGVCLDLLHHPSIDWQGNVHLCNRLDPENKGVIGDIKENSLEEILNGDLRQSIIRQHLEGDRKMVEFCSSCEFWGIPHG